MTFVKICGLTRLKDALVANQAGADFLGFIFYSPSSRSVTPEQAQPIIKHICRQPQLTGKRSTPYPQIVGVFVDEEPGLIRSVVRECSLDWVQLHGEETPKMVSALMKEGIKVIKAFRLRDKGSLEEIKKYRATAYLLDTYVSDQLGGTGKTFDWTLAKHVRKHGPVLLAGGLTPENVSQAIRVAQPWGVDVASGVETKTGHKDHEAVRAFIAAVKQHSLEGGTLQ